jgi:uncharacterized protein YbcI
MALGWRKPLTLGFSQARSSWFLPSLPLRSVHSHGEELENQMSDEQASVSEEATDSQVSVLAEISREMVRLYKEQFGRGPTRARTHFAGPDALICTLEDTFTPAERRLAEMDEHQRLRDTRLYFQHATEEQFCEVIETVLDRKVRGFISGIDTRKTSPPRSST